MCTVWQWPAIDMTRKKPLKPHRRPAVETSRDTVSHRLEHAQDAHSLGAGSRAVREGHAAVVVHLHACAQAAPAEGADEEVKLFKANVVDHTP